MTIHYSPVYIQAQHSIFTYLILGAQDGLMGLNGESDGTISMGEMQMFKTK